MAIPMLDICAESTVRIPTTCSVIHRLETGKKSVINFSFVQMVKTYNWHVLVTFRFVHA